MFGDNKFQKRLEKKLGRVLRRQKPGRKKSQSDNSICCPLPECTKVVGLLGCCLRKTLLFALIFGFPSACMAHELCWTYFPLAPFVIGTASSSIIGAVVVILVIGAYAIVLNRWMSPRGIGRNIWLATLVFIAAKMGECAISIPVLVVAPWVVMDCGDVRVAIALPVAIFAIGTIAGALALWMFCPIGACRRMLAVSVALSTMSYCALLLSVFVLRWFEWMR